MRRRTAFLVVAALFAALSFTFNLQAQPLVNIETVTVGDPGNAADTTGYGAVSNVFAIGKYEVTIGQYTTFLNSVAASDPYGLYNAAMATDLNIAGISRSGTDGSYSYGIISPNGITPPGASSPSNRPIAYVSWFDAARFANWMNNGATNGASTETGAYTLNGATSGIFLKNLEASWWIPSADEWYKSAFYKGGAAGSGYWLYPTQADNSPGNNIGASPNQANYLRSAGIDYVLSVTQTDTGSGFSENQNYLTEVGAFTGSASAYGTFDQAGNVAEWNDMVTDGTWRGLRGSDWNNIDSPVSTLSSGWDGMSSPDFEGSFTGFRLATVPEPSTYALLLMTGAGALWWARRRR